MNNTNKLIVLIVLALIVGVPYWRINHNSQFFAEGLLGQLGDLGEWTHRSVETSLNGKVTINNLTFRPTGYKETISIDAIQVQTDLKKLLFTGSSRLISHLPQNLTLTFQNAQVNGLNSGLQNAINNANYWPMATSFLGAFGCGEAAGPSFSNAQWQQLFPNNPQFNLELNYALVDDYHIDFNLSIDNPENWFITWSGTLTRSSDIDRISFDDTIIDTLYYYHIDQGFNEKRNQVCASANKDSFAAYRLNSAEEIQKYLRVYAGQEMPPFMSNLYQRSLNENIELNAIFDLKDPRYLFEFAGMKQMDFYAQVDMEVALGDSEYQQVELADIDFLNLDMETLRAEMEAKQAEAARIEAEANQPKELLKTVTRSIGRAIKEVKVTNWAAAVGENIKVRTKRGRPIFGRLLAVNEQQITIVSKYMRGNATITVMRDDVVSMSLTR